MDKIPDIRPGDLVKVFTKIVEGDKERLAPFQGVVIKIKGSDISKTFTVRKVSAGIGIERIFPFHSQCSGTFRPPACASGVRQVAIT